jgi:hypothetical protein
MAASLPNRGAAMTVENDHGGPASLHGAAERCFIFAMRSKIRSVDYPKA